MAHSEATARQALKNLLEDYHNLSDAQRKEMTEASVVRQFIDRLLEEVLGWPIKDPQKYKYELSTKVGRPDITLIPDQGGIIFVEAKRFGIIKELEQARYTTSGIVTPGQVGISGMVVDRTPEEQQAINYAFSNNGTWAILTNFEKLRLFNARRDSLVLSFEKPGVYLSEFDFLWQLSYENVINGSLDVLSNQRLRENVDNNYLSFINEWRERLAQDIITRPAKNLWAFDEHGNINLGVLRSVVQRFLDRLVVIRFAEDHLVIPPGTLQNLYETRQSNPYTFKMIEFLGRFFNQFDAKHNSALFARDLTDNASFNDDTIMPLIAKLYEARYRSMPADIIGNTYEQYLGKTLVLDNGSVTTRDNLETRKKQGSYYTPQVIVRYIVDNSLGRYLYGTENGKPDGKPIEGESRKTSRDIKDLRVLDSACGSGSFLIYAYYVLAEFYDAELLRLKADYEDRVRQMAAHFESITTEERIEAERIQIEQNRLEDYPRIILENHLYGTDLDPQAAEIAVVNLMMRAMERRHRKQRLPLILGQNVKVGNGLIGLRPDDERVQAYQDDIAELVRLRLLLHTDPDKDIITEMPSPDPYQHMTLEEAYAIPNPPARNRAIEAITEQMNTLWDPQSIVDESNPTYYELRNKTTAITDELDTHFAGHFEDLERIHPFHWGVEFPEVFYDANGQLLENPGFTMIFGNPPWEILKPDLREFYAQFDPDIESKLTRKKAEQRIAELNAEDPRRQALYEVQTQTIEQSAAYFKQSSDYTHQGRGDTATHKLFTERMYSLLKNTGRLGYIVPSGIYTDLGTKELREMLFNEGHIQYIFSFSNERFFFPGVDHRFKFALIGTQRGIESDGFWAAFRFNPRVAVAPDDLPDFLANEANLVYVKQDSLERFSPDSLSVMEFQTQKDYAIAEKVYGDWPLIGETNSDDWYIKLNNEFHFTNDRHHLNQREKGIPFYEGKMVHQFDAFFAKPQYWIADDNIQTLSETLQQQLKTYRVVHRRIASTTNERTLISAIVPPNSACEVNATVILVQNTNDEKIKPYVCAVLNSFVLDYIIRYKISTTLNMFYMYQLPLPRLTAGNPYFDAIVPRAARLTCTRPEFADLWQAVMGEAWDESKGATNPDERQQLRDDIDAIVAHLYALTRDEFNHILGTFPLAFPDTDAGQAKRERLLSVYDEWPSGLASSLSQ